MHVLVVDDDRADAGLLVEALAVAAPSVRVDVERTAHGALTRLARPPRVAIILLDLNMPGQHGFDVLRRIRSDPALAATPVLILTTSAARQDIQRAYELHANAFITKPADMQETIEAMRRLCDFWCGLAVLPEGR